MVDTGAVKDFIYLGSFLASLGGAFFVAKYQIQKLEKNQENLQKTIDAIGKKFDVFKNEYTESKTICDKEINYLKKEVTYFNDHHLTRQDIENFVTKHQCENRFKEVLPRAEFKLTMEMIEQRFKHMENDIKEIKKDVEKIEGKLETLNENVIAILEFLKKDDK